MRARPTHRRRADALAHCCRHAQCRLLWLVADCSATLAALEEAEAADRAAMMPP
jgi:hypothetical protein